MADPSPATARLGAVVGTDTHEWLPGGHFLVHHVDVTVRDQAVRALIDGIEVGHDTGPRPRVAFEVDDTREVTGRLAGAGAAVVGEPVETPWRSLNARLDGPAGLQLTLFPELEPLDERRRRAGFGTSTSPG